MATVIAIHDSLQEMKNSLSADLLMVRNYRTMVVKNHQFEWIDALKNIEEKIEELIRSVDVPLSK